MTKVVQYSDKSNNPAFAFTIADDTAILHYTESLQNFVSTHGPFIFNAIKDLIPTSQDAPGVAGKDAVSQILDTRTTNQTPGWYHTNNPKKVVVEMKQTAAIGITQAMMPSGQTLGTYASVTTETPWNDTTGGSAFQTAKLVNQTRPVVLIRVGTSDTAWSAWELMTTW